ncbi:MULTISPECIES: hypothetical protein [Methylobacterium]|uniref:hypothetical protein n=1 Tax=Methylobacterium TaxID=407 RepID=UPI001113464F|nr:MULTISPECIES: hypothetical protein [Methylobacterium]MBK3396408.1 hypothetical protein [Methylobacterium ajmalii]MBK3410394.1 hypothetical protein [Methylobacterium ajmalii]MBK3420854.1 hypothetical protein [Methylobacterium ajmalii]MBZ6415875.1 hypothetical protein [Methylobacterium sp.]
MSYLRPFAEKKEVAAPPPSPPPAAEFASDLATVQSNVATDFVLNNLIDPQQASRDQQLENYVDDLVNSKRNRGVKIPGKIYRIGGRILVYGPVRLTNVLWGEVFDEFGTDYQIDKVGG